MRKQHIHYKHLLRDLLIVVVSIVVTVFFVRMGVLGQLLSVAQEQSYLASFIAGIFFTSVFTIAPASVALAEISRVASPIEIAFWAAVGAMLGDLLLFFFVRDVFSADLNSYLKTSGLKRLFAHSHLGFLRWLMPLLGALIIASPLPDELGIALLGLSRVRTILILPVTFCMNYLGILILTMIAKQLA